MGKYKDIINKGTAHNLKTNYEQNYVDTVQVVRCRDCKHYKTMFCKMDIWHKDITLYRADENDFCSYGERRNE